MPFTMIEFTHYFLEGVKVFCGCLGFIASAIVMLCALGLLSSFVGLFIRAGRGDGQ